MSDTSTPPPRKSTSDLLKEAMAKRKAAGITATIAPELKILQERPAKLALEKLDQAAEHIANNLNPFGGKGLLDAQGKDQAALNGLLTTIYAEHAEPVARWTAFLEKGQSYLAARDHDGHAVVHAIAPRPADSIPSERVPYRTKLAEANEHGVAIIKIQRAGKRKSTTPDAPSGEAQKFDDCWVMFTRKHLLSQGVLAAIWTEADGTPHARSEIADAMHTLRKYGALHPLFEFMRSEPEAFFAAVEKHIAPTSDAMRDEFARDKQNILDAIAPLPMVQRTSRGRG